MLLHMEAPNREPYNKIGAGESISEGADSSQTKNCESWFLGGNRNNNEIRAWFWITIIWEPEYTQH